MSRIYVLAHKGPFLQCHWPICDVSSISILPSHVLLHRHHFHLQFILGDR